MEIVRQKNVATRIVFPIVDADGDLVTGASSLDSEIDQWSDGANPTGFADCTNEATEIGSTGIYYLNLTQTEMNEDYIVVQIKTGTAGAKTQVILIRTIVGDPLNLATTDDGGSINVASGVVEAQVKSLDAGVITAGVIAADAIGASELAADAVAEIADAVWDEDATGHQTQGTFGQAIGDPGADTDTIFGLVNTNLNATVSSRASQTSLDTVDDFLDTEIAAIKAKTDNLPSDPADASDIASSFTNVNTKLDTIDDFLDTEVAAIKAKTDNLPSDPADASVVAGLISAVETKVDTVDSVVDAILADTNELQTDWANGGRLDNILDARASQTSVDTIDDFLDTEVQAIKTVTDKLDDTLEDDGGTYRFTENALEEAPSGGASASDIADAVWDEDITTHVLADSTGEALGNISSGASPTTIAEAVWNTKVDNHQQDRSFGSKIGLHLPVVSPDIDYKRIKKVVKEELDDLPKPKEPHFDTTPIIDALQGLYTEVRNIKFPEQKEIDLKPLTGKLEVLQQSVNNIDIPTTDLTETNKLIEAKNDVLDALSEAQEEIKTGQFEKLKTFFKGLDHLIEKVNQLNEKLENTQMLVLRDAVEKPKETKKSVLEEYLNLP